MKIKSVYVDGLHTVHNKTYTFEDITYLHGRNGVGKSTILNAIQFALLGYIPGTSKTKAAILRHSKDNKIVVKIVLDEHSIIPHSVYNTVSSTILGKILCLSRHNRRKQKK